MFIQYHAHMEGLSFLFLLILIQASSCAKVIGVVGQNVTLPCEYDPQTYGVLSFCWGQGIVPVFKCSNTILSAEGGTVLFRKSPRYQLLGRVTKGELSLTILDAQRSDAGEYGCRVEVNGWFNDHKFNTHLIMEEEQPITEDSDVTAEDILITQSPTDMDVSGSTMEKIQSKTNKDIFKAFLEDGNIGRMAVIFFLTIIIILVFIIRRRVLSRRTQHLNTVTVENIYESVSMT